MYWPQMKLTFIIMMINFNTVIMSETIVFSLVTDFDYPTVYSFINILIEYLVI